MSRIFPLFACRSFLVLDKLSHFLASAISVQEQALFLDQLSEPTQEELFDIQCFPDDFGDDELSEPSFNSSTTLDAPPNFFAQADDQHGLPIHFADALSDFCNDSISHSLATTTNDFESGPDWGDYHLSSNNNNNSHCDRFAYPVAPSNLPRELPEKVQFQFIPMTPKPAKEKKDEIPLEDTDNNSNKDFDCTGPRGEEDVGVPFGSPIKKKSSTAARRRNSNINSSINPFIEQRVKREAALKPINNKSQIGALPFATLPSVNIFNPNYGYNHSHPDYSYNISYNNALHSIVAPPSVGQLPTFQTETYPVTAPPKRATDAPTEVMEVEESRPFIFTPRQ